MGIIIASITRKIPIYVTCHIPALAEFHVKLLFVIPSFTYFRRPNCSRGSVILKLIENKNNIYFITTTPTFTTLLYYICLLFCFKAFIIVFFKVSILIFHLGVRAELYIWADFWGITLRWKRVRQGVPNVSSLSVRSKL